jgi:UTP--glucose-1-phosphate uridylyltransferase
MKVRKGVITAAGDRSRRIPLQTLVDRDGSTRTVLAMLVNEIASAGIAEICIVIPPGQLETYRAAVNDAPARVAFVEQPPLPGYASALRAAGEFTGADPFLHLVGDHVYIGPKQKGWAARLVEVAAAQQCSVSAVQATHESQISRFGVVGGTPVSGDLALYRIDAIVEKPTPTEAEQRLIAPGLRAGYYLAFFGMHVLTPGMLDILRGQGDDGSVSDALHQLASKEKYLAWQVSGHRYDLGPRYGLLNAQLALALTGRDRDEVLSSLVGLIGTHGAREQ